jgi:hypothetical protein
MHRKKRSNRVKRTPGPAPAASTSLVVPKSMAIVPVEEEEEEEREPPSPNYIAQAALRRLYGTLVSQGFMRGPVGMLECTDHLQAVAMDCGALTFE